jgi:O-antigen ligase
MSWARKGINVCFHLLLFTVPLIFLPNTSELFEFNKLIITYLFCTLIAFFWVSRTILEKKIIFCRTLLDWPILIFLITQSLSLLFSIDPRTSLLGYYSRFNGGLTSLVCYAFLYWAAVSNLNRKNVLSLVNWTLASAVLVCIWGFLEHFGIDADWWVQDVKSRVFSSLGQPNWLAAFLVALIFIPLSWTIAKYRTSSLLLFLFLFLILLYTKSRSGLLAFGLSSLVFSAFAFRQLVKSVKLVIPVCLLLLLLILTVENPIQRYIPFLHPASETTAPSKTSSPVLETGGTESGNIRKIVWTGALRIWTGSAKNFLIGSGPETFAMAYYQYRPVEHNNTSEWELLYNKAHNEFLNYLSTTGLLGLGSYLVLLGFMTFVLLRNSPLRPPLTTNGREKRKNESFFELRGGSEGALLTALLTGWLSISVTNFWGFSVVIVQIFLFLFPAFAVILTSDSPPIQINESQINKSQIFLLLLSGSSTLILFYSILRYWTADVLYARGDNNLRSFTYTQDSQYIAAAYRDFNLAFDLNRSDPVISSNLGVAASYLALLTSTKDATAAAQLSDYANQVSLLSVRQSPNHPNYYKTRSRVLIALGTIDPKYLPVAEAVLAAAQKLSPTDPRIPYNRGILASYLNQSDLASNFFNQALHLKPDYGDAKSQLDKLKE